MARKGQAWYIDLVAGMFIFVAGLAVYHYANQNISSEDKQLFSDLDSEGDSVAWQLLTPGYPTDWTNESVEQIGVAIKQRLDEGRWAQFSQIPYNTSRRLLGTEYDFFVFIAENNGTVAKTWGTCGIGSPLVNASMDLGLLCLPIDLRHVRYNDLVRKERSVFFDGRIVKIVIYLWR